MKKLLVFALAAISMVACMKEETTLLPQGDAISFDSAFIDNATRAAADPSTTTASLDGFNVWGFVKEYDGTIFNGTEVKKVDGVWGYQGTQYWVPNQPFYFAALAPMNSANWDVELATAEPAKLGLGTVSFTNVNGTEDLLYAKEMMQSKGLNEDNGPVKFQFQHLLSKVKFTFTNGFPTETASIKVTDVKMVVPAAATIDLAQGDYSKAWADHAGTTTLEFGDVEKLAYTQRAEVANERLTIPATAAQEYNITFTVELFMGAQSVYVVDMSSKVSGYELAMGNAYNFTAVINSESLQLEDIVFDVEEVKDWEHNEVTVADANSAAGLKSIIEGPDAEVYVTLTGDINLNDLVDMTRADAPATITVAAGKVVTIDLNGHTLTATDTTSKNYSAIDNRGTLTVKNGTMQVEATINSGWNRYSAVLANNPNGNLTVDKVILEHLGGTDMAYGIDNLTNGKGTSAVTTIKNSTVKSPYRAVRQFLNGVEAANEMYVVASVLEGANKSIFFQDPSAKANTGKLVVDGASTLKGDVYLFVTAGSTEWPVEVSIAESALAEGSVVTYANLPAGYDVVVKDGRYVVEYGVEVNGDEIVVSNAGGLKWIAQQVNSGNDYFAGKTVVLANDIDLKGMEWTPIGSAYADHGFMGNFDGKNYVIKNLAIKEITPDSDGYVYAGLFGVTEGVDANNENYIKNLTIENVDINLDGHIVAAAIAYPYYTVLENITVKGNVNIKGVDYTAGVLAYTRRCVNAKDIAINANEGSVIEGNTTIGGVISDIQMNGGLKANYSNFEATGLTIKGVRNVGGISGIISNQTLDGATVKNVTIVCNDARTGIVAGADGGKSTLTNVSHENVTGATRVIGATYSTGNYVGQIVEVGGQKAVVFSVENGVKAVSVEQGGEMLWDESMEWAQDLGDGWSLASLSELQAIHAVRETLNEALAADDANNALFEEDNKEEDGSYAAYWSSTLVEGSTSKAHYLYFDNDATVMTSFTMFPVEYSRAVYTL